MTGAAPSGPDSLKEIKALARKDAFAARQRAYAAAGHTDASHTGSGQGGAGQGGVVAAAQAHLARALAGFGAVALAGYLPIRTEIDPRPVMAAHPGSVGVPVIPGPAQALIFRRWTPQTALIAGAFGAAIPADGPEIIPRVLIVPLLAFDRRGFRLGYGGGFYDRTLEALRRAGPVTAIGFAFAAQEMAQVPTEATDQPLDLIVTERGAVATLLAG